jgi:FKBP-type peptidyl-prolyl cis-trans isomerase
MKSISDSSIIGRLARVAAAAPLCLGLLNGVACAQDSAADTNAPSLAPKNDGAATETPVFLSRQEKLSYTLGLNTGKSYRLYGVEVDPEIFRQGLKDALSGGKSQITDEEFAFLWEEFQTEMKQKVEGRKKALQAEKALADKIRADKAKADGEAFLAENKTKEGVVALESGLQYKILKPGEGKKPAPGDTVECNYRGTLIDGTEFDNSYNRSKPATFSLKNVIKGWAEALPLMPVGSNWRLFVPSDLAYGPRGAGKKIGPNSTLIFDVDLVSIKERPAARKQAADAGSDGNVTGHSQTENAAGEAPEANKAQVDDAAVAATHKN